MVLNLVKSRANPESLRRIGNLWDVITFWPRSFQPFAVRPYAERAVPELREFVLHGPQRPPLVVTAHSQGSVLIVAALCPVAAEVPTTTGLVTFGSPLRSLYAKLFPRSFPAASLQPVRRWRNVFRYTDHVGRAVFATDGQALDAYERQPTGTLADRPIPDPSPTDPVLEGHNRYWASAEVRDAVKELSDV